MKFSKPLVCTAFAWMLTFTAQSADLAKCDGYYKDRAIDASVRRAYSCYAELAEDALKAENPTLRQLALEKALTAAVWIIQVARLEEDETDLPSLREIRRDFIARALPHTDALIKEFPAAASGYYWRAIYVSFDCGELGYGKKGIDCIRNRIGQVVPDLEKSFALDPSIHGAGPERTMGYTHMFKARMFMSSNAEALKWANASVKRAPKVTFNHMLVAKLQALEGNTEAARKIYEKIIAIDPHNSEQVDPQFVQEAYLDQTKARTALEKL